MRSSIEQNVCRVCGLEQADPPWGEDGCSPTYEICSCCGTEFGYEDATVIGVKNHRKKWLDEGKIWFDLNEKPDDWNFEEQFSNVPDDFL